MRALLVSTYELGRQPFGLASPAAWLRREGLDVELVDAAKTRLEDATVQGADLIGFHLPMHTATRLAAPLIRRARAMNPAARICAFGLYAPLNAEWLRSLGVDDLLGGEFEGDLAAIARALGARAPVSHAGPSTGVARLAFITPDRTGLPPLTRYATLQLADGRSVVAGYTEASRGCRHLCRHCPVVPVYEGQFRVLPVDVVMADVASQVAAGARHITFGDPDFFNGPTHALRIVQAFATAHPGITYDVTIKIEHLLQQRRLLPKLADTGCLFVTSAVESLDDRVLALLEKGHTRADVLEAVALCRAERLTLVPTFVPFHPWTTMQDYCDLLDTIEALDLVDHVAGIQLAIRLLVPAGSRFLEVPELRSRLGAFDARTLAYPWTHEQPDVDRLHADVTALVGASLSANRRETFDAISALAHERAGLERPEASSGAGAPVPFMSEPWYCCAEPNPDQLRIV